jgi:hypothetical protein
MALAAKFQQATPQHSATLNRSLVAFVCRKLGKETERGGHAHSSMNRIITTSLRRGDCDVRIGAMSVSHCEAVTETLMSKVCETVSVTQTIVTVTTVLLLNVNKSVINLVWLDRGRTGGNSNPALPLTRMLLAD